MSTIFISIFRIFHTEIPLSKQGRPWWDAAWWCHHVASHLGLRCLPRSFFLDARHKWVNSSSNLNYTFKREIKLKQYRPFLVSYMLFFVQTISYPTNTHYQWQLGNCTFDENDEWFWGKNASYTWLIALLPFQPVSNSVI